MKITTVNYITQFFSEQVEDWPKKKNQVCTLVTKSGKEHLFKMGDWLDHQGTEETDSWIVTELVNGTQLNIDCEDIESISY